MTDDEITDVLAALGIDAGSWRLVALLPMIQVAWADGSVSAPERALILDIAKKRQLVDDAGLKLLDRWLNEPPSPFYLSQARKVLAGLIGRRGWKGGDLHVGDDLIAWCEGVADASGGLFGLFGRTDAAEREALETIARALHLKPGRSWDQVREDLKRG